MYGMAPKNSLFHLILILIVAFLHDTIFFCRGPRSPLIRTCLSRSAPPLWPGLFCHVTLSGIGKQQLLPGRTRTEAAKTFWTRALPTTGPHLIKSTRQTSIPITSPLQTCPWTMWASSKIGSPWWISSPRLTSAARLWLLRSRQCWGLRGHLLADHPVPPHPEIKGDWGTEDAAGKYGQDTAKRDFNGL